MCCDFLVFDLWGSSKDAVQQAVTKTLKKCKKKKKRPSCKLSEFGCCPDDKTPADGPFSKGWFYPSTAYLINVACDRTSTDLPHNSLFLLKVAIISTGALSMKRL